MTAFFLTIALCASTSGGCKSLHVDDTYWSEKDCQAAAAEFIRDHFDEMHHLGYTIQGFTCLRTGK